MDDLPAFSLADEFLRPHQTETLGQTIARSSVIDVHRPQTEWAVVSIATVAER
jgi:hypothetical protein